MAAQHVELLLLHLHDFLLGREHLLLEAALLPFLVELLQAVRHLHVAELLAALEAAGVSCPCGAIWGRQDRGGESGGNNHPARHSLYPSIPAVIGTPAASHSSRIASHSRL